MAGLNVCFCHFQNAQKELGIGDVLTQQLQNNLGGVTSVNCVGRCKVGGGSVQKVAQSYFGLMLVSRTRDVTQIQY